MKILGCAATAMLACLCTAAGVARPRTCTPIPEEKIAYQLYNLLPVLAEHGQPPVVFPAMLDTRLAAIRATGFRKFERFGDTLGIAIPDYAALARKNGQAVIGSQGSLDPG